MQDFEMRCYWRLLNISYKDHVTNEEPGDSQEDQIDISYLCHIDLKMSSLTAVTYCRLELQPVVTKFSKCDICKQIYKIISHLSSNIPSYPKLYVKYIKVAV